MERGLVERFKAQRISIYALHVPLDNFSDYSTSGTLAQALGIDIEEKFLPYGGGLAGVIGTSDVRTVSDLQARYSRSVGHETSLYAYGPAEIARQKLAIVAGGGNSVEFLQQVVEKGINTLVTGVTVRNDFSRLAHELASEKKVNLLGGTHYSSEAFACKAMCRYFEELGLPARYLDDDPCLADR
jgi:putative NIF3 family GTP cyclohydrolase 1 type 2